jgi:hypothetical protein
MQSFPVRIHDSVAGVVSAAALNQRVFVHSSPEVTVPMGVFRPLSVLHRIAPPCAGAVGVVAEAIRFLTGGVDVEVRCLSMGQDDPFAMETLLADPILRNLRYAGTFVRARARVPLCVFDSPSEASGRRATARVAPL